MPARARRDWRALPAFTIGVLIPCAWIAGAVYLAVVKKTLPIDYFHTSPWLSKYYNTLVTAVGAITGFLTFCCAAEGLKNVIRCRIASSRGLKLKHYTFLFKIASGGFLYRVNVAAVAAFAVLVCVNQFSAATQAAFGTTPTPWNSTTTEASASIFNNLETVKRLLDPKVLLANPGQILGNMVAPSIWGTFITIDGFEQKLADEPLIRWAYYTYWHSGRIVMPMEGILANATCQAIEADYNQTRTRLASVNLIAYTLRLPACGSATKLYDASITTLYDTYACLDSQPVVYILNPHPAKGTIESLYSCQVAVFSAMYDGTLYNPIEEYHEWYQPNKITPKLETLDLAQDLVRYSGQMLLNSFGLNGSPALSQYFEHGRNQDFLELARLSISATLTTLLISHTTYYFTEMQIDWGEVNEDLHGVLVNSYVPLVTETDRLKMHLSGPAIAWIALPVALLALMLVLVFFGSLSKTTAHLDLIDPVEVAIEALTPGESQLWLSSSPTSDKSDARLHFMHPDPQWNQK